MKNNKKKTAEPSTPAPRETSELNNLLQIISGTTDLIENIWSGRDGSEKYFAMLRASIERLTTADVPKQIQLQAGETLAAFGKDNFGGRRIRGDDGPFRF